MIRIDQRGGSAQRTGSWLVPWRLKLRPKWCQVTLDFTDAVITHDALDIDMNMRGGALILVTTLGMTVDADALSVRYSAAPSRCAASSLPAPARRAGRRRGPDRLFRRLKFWCNYRRHGTE